MGSPGRPGVQDEAAIGGTEPRVRRSSNIGMLVGGVIVDDGVDRLTRGACFSMTLRKRMNS